MSAERADRRGLALRATPSAESLRLAGSAAGMVLCMTAYGLLQERVMAHPFGGEFFDASLFVLLANRLLTCVLAGALCVGTGAPLAPRLPLRSCAAVAATNGLATWCQFEALRLVSFTAVTLAKSAKLLPVLLWGTVVLRRRYHARDYLAAAGIAAGCALFVTTGSVTARQPPAAALDALAASSSTTLAAAARRLRVESSGGGGGGAADSLGIGAATAALPAAWRHAAGAGLLVAYLAFDGLTATYQEHLFLQHSGLTASQLVMYVAAIAGAFAATGAIATGQLAAGVRFAMAHPEVSGHIAALSLAAAGASLLINDTIRRFGALAFAGIMTSRQLVSVVVNTAAFRQRLTGGQVAGATLLFACVYARLFFGGEGGGGRRQQRSSDIESAAAEAEAEKEHHSETPRSPPRHALSARHHAPASPGAL